MVKTVEMRNIRVTQGKTLRDKIRNENPKERRNNWNEHVKEWDNNRLPKQAKEVRRPTGIRSERHPPKR